MSSESDDTPSASSIYVELTDPLIRATTLPPGRTQSWLRDTELRGLAVRLRQSGAKSFAYFHTRPGLKGSYVHHLGAFPKIKVKDARKAAAILAGQQAAGSDLTRQKRDRKDEAKKAATSRRATLGSLIAEGGPYEASLKARAVVATPIALSALRRNLLPEHRHTDLRKLARLDVTTAMDKLISAGKPGAAGDFRKHCMTFLNWAMKQGHIDHNVLAGFRMEKQTRAQKLGGRKAKQRALNDDEIKAMWNAAGKLGSFGLLAQLCLLGGPRRSEPTMIEWSKHVMEDRVTFDAHWTKMGLHHDIPRSALVDQVLDAAKHFQRATSDLVFPSSKTGGRISGFNKLVKRLIEEAGTDKWTMHDLRRTLRTVMSRCGYDNDIQRLCVGQKPRGIDAVYNKDEQWIIRTMAFEAAHAYIAAVIEGQRVDNVVRLQRAANPQNKIKAELLARLREHHAGS